MSMLVSRFDAQNLRGIHSYSCKGGVPLDAPLTLIVAPNGTGKTSMIDGLEWLLTGEVERFKGRMDYPALLRNQLIAPDAPIIISATLTAEPGRGERELRLRSSKGKSKLERRDEGVWKTCQHSSLIDDLTPRTLAEAGKKPADVRARQLQWLRAVRFLGPENLARLSSSEERSAKNRPEHFADVVGETQLRRRRDDLLRIAERFPAKERELENREEELQELKRRRDAIAVRDTGPEIASFDAQLTEWRSNDSAAPDLPPSGFAALDQRVRWQSIAEDETRSHHAKLLQRGSEMEDFLVAHPDYEAAQAALQAWEKVERDDVTRALARVETRAKNAAAHHAALQRECDQLEEQRGSVVETVTALRAKHDSLAALVSALESVADEEMLRLTASEFRARETKAREQVAQKQAGHEEIEVAIIRDTEMRGFALQAQKLRRTLEPLRERKWMDSDEVEKRRASVREAEVRLERQRTDIERQVGLWQRWNLQVQPYLSEFLRRECPLCGHSHHTSAHLQLAIKKTLVPLPPEIEKATAELKHLERSWAKEAAFLEEEGNIRLEFERNDEALKNAEAEIVRYRQGMSVLIAPPQSLEEIHTKLHAARRASHEKLQSARKEEKRWADACAKHESLLEWQQVKGRVAEIDLEITVSGRLERGRENVGAMARRIAGSASEVSRIESVLADKKNEMQHAEAERKEAAEALERVRENTTKRRAEIERLEARLQKHRQRAAELALVDPFGAAAGAALGQVEAALREVLVHQVRLKALRERLDEARVIERTLGERQRLDERVVQLVREVETLRNRKHIKARLEARIAEISGAIDGAVRRAFAAFFEPMQALFLRAQANAFVERIALDDAGGEGARLLAHTLRDAGRLKLSELSQGQRQDLALALFLARAQHEGGSFFLDEPLSHLDDMNRVALLDSLRAIVLAHHGGEKPLRIVLTTASHALMRHLKAKFFHLELPSGQPFLRVVELHGNAAGPLRIDLSPAVPSKQM